jgi:hypothetical protein
MNYHRNFFLLTGIITVLLCASGCLENYGKIRVASGDFDAIIQQVKENWDEYSILYAGPSTGSPSAIMFAPKADGKRLLGKKWVPVTEKSDFDEIVGWLESDITFPPTLYEVLSPEGVFFGYIYASHTLQIVIRKIDRETLEMEDIPLPPIDYSPGGGRF